MLRIVLILVVLALVAIGGIAVALNHFFGWKGWVAFPIVLIVLLWLGKLVAGKLFRRFLGSLFGIKSGVLRDAAVVVHSVAVVPRPVDEPLDLDEDDEGGSAALPDGEEEEEVGEAERPCDYYAVELTITPREAGEGHVWEPGELMLTTEPSSNLEQLADKEVGTTHSVEIWKGEAYGPDEGCKYPGEQRLRVTFQVEQGTKSAYLQYYNVYLGPVDFSGTE